jgi:hypothetical protein
MSDTFQARTIELLERAGFARILALAFVILVAVHADCLQDPPYWDALMGAFAQGHWLATRSFSPLALLRDSGAFNDGGACVYPFSVYPWLVGGLEASGLAPSSVFLVLHLVSFAAAAAIVAALFGLMRDVVGPGLAALVALALMAQPMFRALACQMNMDMPLAACTLLSVAALSRERHRAACAWSVAALLVKPTAIILIGANLAALALRLARPAWFVAEADDAWKRRVRLAWLVHACLFAVFVAELLVAAHFGKSTPGVALFGGTAQFLVRRLWTLPEFGLALGLFLVLAPWIALRAARGRADPLEIDLGLLLLAFTGFYCQYVNVLPRYFLQVWPALLGALVLGGIALAVPRRSIGALLVLFAVLGVVNTHGRFHPTRWAEWREPGSGRPLVSNDGWLLERSMEYRDDLAIDRELARRLEEHAGRRVDQEGGELVTAGWPLLQLLAIPQLGYVKEPLRLESTETPIHYGPAEIPRAGSALPGESRLRVISPNVYGGEHSRVLPRDIVLDTVEEGRLRAFIVRRPAESGSGGR